MRVGNEEILSFFLKFSFSPNEFPSTLVMSFERYEIIPFLVKILRSMKPWALGVMQLKRYLF